MTSVFDLPLPAIVIGVLTVIGLIVLCVAVVVIASGKKQFVASFRGFGVDVKLTSVAATKPGELK